MDQLRDQLSTAKAEAELMRRELHEQMRHVEEREAEVRDARRLESGLSLGRG